MVHLIDKDAVVAEIKKLLAFYLKEIEDDKEDPWAMDIAKRDILQEILSFIDTLGVKEVDLQKEVERFVQTKEFYECTESPVIVIAKHFFELGMQINNKVQKGE